MRTLASWISPPGVGAPIRKCMSCDALLAAHGAFLKTGAHAAVEQAIARAFPG